ncbi:methyltransferase domain-containing protein [Rhodobacterales bacterium HKCCE2091]|nr:methyltransferase domain-containing protein [Rhodobacterales bacterium HKCCE2091]
MKQAKPKGGKQGEAARRAAWDALMPVFTDRQMLPVIAPRDGLTPAEAARAGRLALTVLRHLGRIDAILAPYLRHKPPLQVMGLLRLGAAELLVDGAAAHGVVDGYVSLAKRGGSKAARAAGLLNAVLRRVAETGAETWAGQVPQSLPQWLRKPLVAAWGEAATKAIEAVHEAGAPIDLTAKPGVAIEGADRLPTGSWRLKPGAQVSAVPGYAEGAFWVQDAGAALAARALGDVAGLRVLDMCAAPGGKTMQLAAAGAEVTALDISEDRMARVAENLARTGLQADCVTADALVYDAAPFDAILLDAPCSATGTIRRHPELPLIRGPKDVTSLTRLQARLIDRALGLLKPGGRLVYCTCSLLPAEGEDQVAAAFSRHPRLAPVALDPVALGAAPEWSGPHGSLRLRPDFWRDIGGIDGFCIALLEAR